MVVVLESKIPVMPYVAVQTECDLFINEACKDVLHFNISFEQMSASGKMKLYIFTAVGGQAEENQDANNYYANHL